MTPAIDYTGPLQECLTFDGYAGLKTFDGMLCGLMQFMFTVGLCYGIDRTGYTGRYCFSSLEYALGFYYHWDGKTPPVIGVDGCTAIK
jgi:hypothetical protein